MTKKSKVKVPFKFVGISTEEFATFEKNYISGKNSFDIRYEIDVSTSPSNKAVGVFISFSFDQNSLPVLVLKCGCHFQLEESYWFKHIEHNELTLPNGLLTHLLVLTVGTARGVIHAKKPKWMPDVFLPTVDVSNMITDDMQFDLTTEEEE